MTLLLLYLFVAIFVSFLCSVLEAVLLSITPSYIESLKEQKKFALSKRLGELKSDIDKPLAAILSFNTIAHTVGAAGVGAQAAKVFGDAYLGVISAVLTLLILIFSEIIPKTIGANYWRSLGAFTAKTLRILIFLMYPLVLLSKVITKILSGKEKKATISRAEVSAMADIGHKEGVFHEAESKMLKNMIRFRHIKAEDIMTPRTVMSMVQQDTDIEEILKTPDFKRFSRIPIFKDNRDDIKGYVLKTDVFMQLAEGKKETPLLDIKRDILMISKEMELSELLDKFLVSKEHIALATDRYGGVSGLVTMEDIMETLLGAEITDEYDGEEDLQRYARQKWRKRALQLGIITEEHELEKPLTETKEVVHFGITGGQPPGLKYNKEDNSESKTDKEDEK